MTPYTFFVPDVDKFLNDLGISILGGTPEKSMFSHLDKYGYIQIAYANYNEGTITVIEDFKAVELCK